MCQASFQALGVWLGTTTVCCRLTWWMYRSDSTETLSKCDEQHKWGQNVLGAWNGGKGAIPSEDPKSFPEEVALNFRTKAKQGRESRGQWWGGPWNMEAGDTGRPWRPWTLLCGTWEAIWGQLQNPICPQTHLSRHPASNRRERRGVMWEALRKYKGGARWLWCTWETAMREQSDMTPRWWPGGYWGVHGGVPKEPPPPLLRFFTLGAASCHVREQPEGESHEERNWGSWWQFYGWAWEHIPLPFWWLWPQPATQLQRHVSAPARATSPAAPRFLAHRKWARWSIVLF